MIRNSRASGNVWFALALLAGYEMLRWLRVVR